MTPKRCAMVTVPLRELMTEIPKAIQQEAFARMVAVGDVAFFTEDSFAWLAAKMGLPPLDGVPVSTSAYNPPAKQVPHRRVVHAPKPSEMLKVPAELKALQYDALRHRIGGIVAAMDEGEEKALAEEDLAMFEVQWANPNKCCGGTPIMAAMRLWLTKHDSMKSGGQ